MHGAAGQPPDQIGIDGAEREFATLGATAGVGDIVENPGDLRGGEIRIEQKAGARLDEILGAVRFQARAGLGGATVLPDDRVIDGFAAAPVPDQRRLSLIGDAERDDIALRRLGDRPAQGFEGGAPYVFGIVLDPSRARVELRKLLLRDGERRGVGAEHHGAGRSRSLIDDEDMRRHGVAPRFRRFFAHCPHGLATYAIGLNGAARLFAA